MYYVFFENRIAFVAAVSFSRALAACERLEREAEEKSRGEFLVPSLIHSTSHSLLLQDSPRFLRFKKAGDCFAN